MSTCRGTCTRTSTPCWGAKFPPQLPASKETHIKKSGRFPLPAYTFPNQLPRIGGAAAGEFLRAFVARLMPDDEIDYDVAVNVMKGSDGYGIYFNSGEGTIKVTKLDKGSEAERAGVQVKDELVGIQDNDKVQPPSGWDPNKRPGDVVGVSLENYQKVLNLVREMKNCKLFFRAPPPPGGAAF